MLLEVGREWMLAEAEWQSGMVLYTDGTVTVVTGKVGERDTYGQLKMFRNILVKNKKLKKHDGTTERAARMLSLAG